MVEHTRVMAEQGFLGDHNLDVGNKGLYLVYGRTVPLAKMSGTPSTAARAAVMPISPTGQPQLHRSIENAGQQTRRNTGSQGDREPASCCEGRLKSRLR